MERVKYYTAYIPTWGFYWAGDLVSKLIPYKMEFLIPIYSHLMGWSLFFNDWGGLDCWLEGHDTEYDE